MPYLSDFDLCCGAKVISSFSIFKKEPRSWEAERVFKENTKRAYLETDKFLVNTNYYAIYVAILNDVQLYINEQLLFKHGFRKVARGLNPVHDGSNNTLYVKVRTEGWYKEAKQDDLHSFNPSHEHDKNLAKKSEEELNALVAEWEDAGDLKSPAKKLVGSSPTKGTTPERDEHGRFKKKEKLVPEGREWRAGDILRAIDYYNGHLVIGQEYTVVENDIHTGTVLVDGCNLHASYHRFEFVRKGPAWEN